jgi:opacity protein-like surface antigen
MKPLILLALLFLGSCATKYIIPGNRFITAETQGGQLKGAFEFQQTSANQLTIDTSQGTVDEGVTYAETTRSGFQFSESLFNSFDFMWAHTGSANSMLGGKLQIIGDSRASKATGHKVSLAALFGGNEHETDDESVKFELGGKEFLIIYGYRINESILPYTGLSIATYNFNGKIHSSDSSLNGLEPKLTTKSTSLNTGVEFTWESFFAKLEATYQKLTTTDTKDKDRFMYGYSIGYSW